MFMSGYTLRNMSGLPDTRSSPAVLYLLATGCLAIVLPVITAALWLVLGRRVPLLLLATWTVFLPLSVLMLSGTAAAWGVVMDASSLGLRCAATPRPGCIPIRAVSMCTGVLCHM